MAFQNVNEERLFPCVGLRTRDEEVRSCTRPVTTEPRLCSVNGGRRGRLKHAPSKPGMALRAHRCATAGCKNITADCVLAF